MKFSRIIDFHVKFFFFCVFNVTIPHEILFILYIKYNVQYLGNK